MTLDPHGARTIHDSDSDGRARDYEIVIGLARVEAALVRLRVQLGIVASALGFALALGVVSGLAVWLLELPQKTPAGQAEPVR